MINEAKFELLNQVDFWTKDLERYGKKHQRVVELFQLEKLALINASPPPEMESIIRKYEQLKQVYQEITSNHSQGDRDETFAILYNKYCMEKRKKNQPFNMFELRGGSNVKAENSSTKVQPSLNQQATVGVSVQIIDEYIDEIDFYADKITNLQQRIECHQHEQLLRLLQQAQQESEDLRSEFRVIVEENEKIKEVIVNNQQRVTELRELQLQLIDEFKQIN